MKALTTVLIVILLVMAGALAYQFFWPSKIKERAVETALQQFADIMETQDRAKVGETLKALLTDDARIHLEVNFFMPVSFQNSKPIVQDFDPTSFGAFIDNILYSVSDYHFRPKLTAFAMSDDHTATVAFTSAAWAAGPSYYGAMPVMMRFHATTDCNGKVVFGAEGKPRLSEAQCTTQMRSVPKADDLQQMKTPKNLQELLGTKPN